MKIILGSFIFLILILGSLVPSSNASVPKIVALSGETPDGKVGVSFGIDEPQRGREAQISIGFFDPRYSDYRDLNNVKYEIQVSQMGQTVYRITNQILNEAPYPNVHHTPPLPSNSPYDITVFVVSVGNSPVNQPVFFSNIIPEFGPWAIVILGLSITSFVIFTNKSRLNIYR